MTRTPTPAFTRRALLAAMPATGAALALPSVASAEAPDPVVRAYHDWMAARREWGALMGRPEHGNGDTTPVLDAQQREYEAEERMLTETPTSLEGIAALSALAWYTMGPSSTDPEQFAREVDTHESRLILALWRGCTGQDGYPVS
ncbi:hypothetical protein [Tropicibacter alexandrii]|uniref:hypothetical protein n=1 Tax=Tropicibacter alexandrii TaxID=2267683 RepID=UPI000EF4DCC3|nr:hypothetical protein [Tropicibacter alexandrii]